MLKFYNFDMLGLYRKLVNIVLYTGNKKWDARTEYSDEEYSEENYKNGGNPNKKNGMNCRYYLIDVNEIDTEELLNSESLLENIMGVEKLKENELFENIMKIIIKEKNKGNIEKIAKLLKYVFVDIMSKREINDLIKEMKKEKEECKMLSLGQRIAVQMRKEGIEVGRAEGKTEGRVEGIVYVAKEMIKKHIPIKTIEEVTKIKEEELKEMQKQIAI